MAAKLLFTYSVTHFFQAAMGLELLLYCAADRRLIKVRSKDGYIIEPENQYPRLNVLNFRAAVSTSPLARGYWILGPG